MLCLFYHHMWIGAFFTIGAGAHASIFIIVDQQAIKNYSFSFILLKVLNHRDLIIGHLIWVTIALGLHSFSIYIHKEHLRNWIIWVNIAFITTPYKLLVVQKISLVIILFHYIHYLLVGCKVFLTLASILRC